MKASVDVLAVMNVLASAEYGVSYTDEAVQQQARKARAAVAELIEAGREVSETHEAFQRNPVRMTANAANKADGRLRAAIARVGGAP